MIGLQRLFQKLSFLSVRKILSKLTIKRPSFKFVSCPNTGKVGWTMVSEDYDYVQEIARSAYADMLHDWDRNQKFEAGIKSAIAEMKKRGIEPRVLDIGTGTGLLSMMACRHGANHVVACEAFLPMADIAYEVIKDNGFAHKIKIVPKRSTSMMVDADMEGMRANILVTEMFDTELIGEGAIETFRHAIDNLLVSDCLVVPSRARMYVQVVDSLLVQKWHRFNDIQVDNKVITIPKHAKYPAGDVFYDLQLSLLPIDSFTLLSKPMVVFDFDLSGKTRLKDNEQSITEFLVEANGYPHAVFMWWDCQMDVEGDVWIDMKPANLAKGYLDYYSPTFPWRDHWMQAIYFLTDAPFLKKSDNSYLLAKHDPFSLDFEVSQINLEISSPFQKSSLPSLLPRAKLGYLNCDFTRQKLIVCLKKVIKNDSVVVCIGGSSIIPIIGAALNAKKIFIFDSNHWTADWVHSICAHNHLHDKIKVIGTPVEQLHAEDLEGLKVDVVVSDVYPETLNMPWDCIDFIYAVEYLKPYLKDNFVCLPKKGYLKGICLHLKDLWKIRSPVGISAQGFNLAKFDEVIMSACDDTDPLVEPQPLWEYPNQSLSDVLTLLTIDSLEIIQGHVLNEVKFELNQVLLKTIPFNGIAFWMEWEYDNDTIVSTGLLEDELNYGMNNCETKNTETFFEHAQGFEINVAFEKEECWNKWNRNWNQGIYIYNKKDMPKGVSVQVKLNVKCQDVSFEICAYD